MLSTKRHGTSILTIKEILENGFVAGASSYTHSSPVHSYYMDNSSASKPDTWEFLMDLDNATKGSSLCGVKQSESLSSCVKTDLHSLTQGVSDLSLVCFCKTHHSQAAFDLSGLPCEQHPSRAGCLMDVASQNTSTPCKKEKHPKLLESLLSKSIELVGDLSTLGKTPAPRWEISAIKAPLDTSLSLDVSTEELRLPGCSKPDTPSLETSVVIPLAWPGAFKRHPMLMPRSATPETQLSDPEPVPVLLHQALCCPGSALEHSGLRGACPGTSCAAEEHGARSCHPRRSADEALPPCPEPGACFLMAPWRKAESSSLG